MELPLQPTPDDLKRLGARDGRMVREQLETLLTNLDLALYREFSNASNPVDIYQLQGSAKVVRKLREVLNKAVPAPF